MALTYVRSYGLKRYMEKDMLREDGRVVFDIRLPPARSGARP